MRDRSGRRSLAVNQHDCHESEAPKPAPDRQPVEFVLIVAKPLKGAQPAFPDPRVPKKIAFLCIQKSLRQSLADTVAKVGFQSWNHRCHDVIRRRSYALNHAHVDLHSLRVLAIENGVMKMGARGP